ncbi:hypothetical protein NHX12_004581 [Muraenolepis orangiensis]|uniref:Hexosyltransferase n=1 Tax=Muraenolepis orangiensis TaxID=630683 RepID=A0A9Q0DZB2_9TELE|nr:hypothetical protein NHX12_004581 [Muraenolepis orangiensis]
MQWRRRHCYTNMAGFLYLLSLLGVLVFLVHQDWLPGLTGPPWRTGHPVDYGGGGLHATKAKGNLSSRQTLWRFVIVPQPTANISSAQEVYNLSPRGELDQKYSPAANTSQSEEWGVSGKLTSGPYTYIINEPNKCPEGKAPPFLVLLIATEARQVEARDAIRQTWGNESIAPGIGIARLFLLGANEGELGRLQQRMLEAESLRHHDIIQQDFLDAYNNLTAKTLMGMNWVALHCRRAGYVMKTDSDMFVNTEYLIHKLLRPELKSKKRHFFTGNNMRGFAPNRNKNSKWYMSPELYPSEKYPTFCSGTGYVFSGDLAGKVYRASLSIRRLHLEDVYVGLCLAKLGLEPVPPPNEFLFNHWRVSYSSCKYSHLITSHGFHPNELIKYWNHLQINKHNACINSLKEKMGRLHQNRPQ